MKQTTKRGKAWRKHKPGRKELAGIALKNRVVVVVSEVEGTPIPLKRKYLVYRAHSQAGKPGAANPAKANIRPYFPMGRIRAIKSSLAG